MNKDKTINEAISGRIKALKDEREAKKKLNRQARNRRYYLKHQSELKKRARDTYYQLREGKDASNESAESDLKISTEETETSRESEHKDGKVSVIVPVMVAAATVGIAIAATQRNQKQQSAAIVTPDQYTFPFDMGGGRIIQIKKS